MGWKRIFLRRNEITVLTRVVLILMLCQTSEVGAFSSTIPRSLSQRLPAADKKFQNHQRLLFIKTKGSGSTRRRRIWNGRRRNKAQSPTNNQSSSSTLPKRAVKIYTDYARRLWKETDREARQKIARGKAAAAIRSVEKIMQGDAEYVEFSEQQEAREQLLESCRRMLKAIELSSSENVEPVDDESLRKAVDSADISGDEAQSRTVSKAIALESGSIPTITNTQKKPRRSILFGAVMGLIVAGWVFSGNYIFTGVFTLMTVLGQLEYYRMVMNTGIYPARRISIIGACSMFLTVRMERRTWYLRGLWYSHKHSSFSEKTSTIDPAGTACPSTS
jgi:hypothetical protein